jgi:serine/threonine protein phosphatase PrpC
MQPKDEIKILLNETDTIQSDILGFGDYKIGFFIKHFKDGDRKNEDSLFILGKNKDLLFGVSDGAGGHPKGAEASKIASTNIIKYFEQNDAPNFANIIEKINDDILALKAGAHATLSFGHINENFFRSHSVGDSEIIYWNSNGKELYSNVPQSEVGYLIESGAIDQGDSLDDPNRYLVSNLLGDSSIRIESASRVELKKGHTIVIGSDGLFDNISHEELTNIISGGPFEESFNNLCKICETQEEKSWKKYDDLSLIVVRKINA